MTEKDCETCKEYFKNKWRTIDCPPPKKRNIIDDWYIVRTYKPAKEEGFFSVKECDSIRVAFWKYDKRLRQVKETEESVIDIYDIKWNFYDPSGGYVIDDITHWMPLSDIKFEQ